MMKNHRLNFASVFVVLVLILLSGCASDRDLIRDNTVTVVRIGSNSAYIKSMSIQQVNDEVSVSGVVKRRHSGRGSVRGHVDLFITEPDGRLISKKEVPYYRKNLKKGEAHFHVTLGEEPQSGSLLRLSLHNTLPHSDSEKDR
jgi:hypothetical protein